ncbi:MULTISPECIES: YdcF family protein [unclassified Oceanispirochaeta]|uniref:YdcF family protein n=1 Tax=unclassified Oceanispirochaeta TaxID=2635722 RepID=UPI000E09388B|nr:MULTISPECIES: YdcF family protein [unclassified Oceanispirochaeta]MBF9015549.1 YdcF family protein [Oceanispirochaeta sp. M2]NPD73962.1 YdcF family protein [Oceanispirochaeta sp. M1]RDG30272.1 YdcF family protein [Oceanispirochaeta sp. M1]
MFYISKIITAFIMPPGLILAVMIFILFFIRKKRFPFFLLLSLTLFFYLLSSRFISEALIYPLESYAVEAGRDAYGEAELIVVLGGGSVVQKDENDRLRNSPANVTADRLLEAILLQKETGLPLLFTGGNVLKGRDAPGEAEGVRIILKRYGLSEDMYILESESRNTYENALYSSEKTSYRDIILISSAFHLKRAALCFEASGFRISSLRAVDLRVDEKKISVLDFLPSMGALQNSYTALHEYWGLLYYRLYYFSSV